MKKKKARAVVVILLAAILLACLVYTRPKTLDQLMEGREITSLAAVTIQTSISYGRVQQDTWNLSHEQASPAVIADLREIMSTTRYRTSLRTLLQPSSFEREGDRTVMLIMVLDDGSSLTIDYFGDELVMFNHWDAPTRLFLCPLDKEICTRLSDHLMEIGTKE